MWQKLFIFGVGTDENGTNTGEIVNGNLLSSFTYLRNNTQGLVCKLNQPLKVINFLCISNILSSLACLHAHR